VFEGIRLRLTAWYVAVLLVIVVIMGSITYVMLSNSLKNEVDDSLRSGARSIAAQVDESGLDSLTPPSSGGGEDGEEEEHEEDGHEVRFYTPSSGDTFYLVVSPDGQVLANPLNVKITGVPDSGGAAAAANRGESWSDVTADDDDYRLYSYAIRHDGETTAVVQVGRSLEEHQRQLEKVVVVVALSGLAGLALAAGGGLLLAGRALAPAREAFQRQRSFVADASHEVRTPLTIVRGNAEMLEMSAGDRLTEEERKYLAGIVGQVRYMERLTEDLSMLARMDRGDTPLRCEEFDLKALLDEVASDGRLLGKSKDVAVKVDAPDIRIEADRDRIRELLLLLVDNSVRAVAQGGRVTLASRRTDDGVEVEVTDNGPGIPEEHRHLIFERFHRVDTGRSRSEGGSGLGLAIAKAIAHAHGGDITADSAPGGGAVLRIHLPG
jgi:signal transduction histidine kinase